MRYPLLVLAHADRLAMPTVLTMAERDASIPVAETRKIARAIVQSSRFVYHEVPGGEHTSVLWVEVDLKAVRLRWRLGGCISPEPSGTEAWCRPGCCPTISKSY